MIRDLTNLAVGVAGQAIPRGGTPLYSPKTRRGGLPNSSGLGEGDERAVERPDE